MNTKVLFTALLFSSFVEAKVSGVLALGAVAKNYKIEVENKNGTKEFAKDGNAKYFAGRVIGCLHFIDMVGIRVAGEFGSAKDKYAAEITTTAATDDKSSVTSSLTLANVTSNLKAELGPQLFYCVNDKMGVYAALVGVLNRSSFKLNSKAYTSEVEGSTKNFFGAGLRLGLSYCFNRMFVFGEVGGDFNFKKEQKFDGAKAKTGVTDILADGKFDVKSNFAVSGSIGLGVRLG
ncbi:MAG: hypothetical protein H6845_02070 [Alphaproteobacteria bacterium]|nr:MAG: hypothetical protein H6845_02070 [Alphaproteobacteria bacterium]